MNANGSPAEGLYAVVGFLLELAVYASAVVWALTLRRGWVVRVALAVAAVAVAATAWALFAAPGAVHPLHGAGRVVFEVCWYGAGAAALIAARTAYTDRRPAG